MMKKRLKILLIFSFKISLKIWDDYGLIYREIQLYKKFKKKNIDYIFLTYGDDSDLKYKILLNNIEVFPLAKSGKYKNNYLLLLLKSILIPIFSKKLMEGLSIIKTNQLEGSWVFWLPKLIFRKKVIVRGGYEWFKNYILRNYLKKKKNLKYWLNYFAIFLIEKISYKLADKIILTNPEDIEFIVKKFKLNKEKISLIYNFIDTEVFKPLKIKKKEKHVIFVGRIEKEKNLINLIKAFETLKDFTLNIIGDGSEEYKKFLFKIIDKLDVKVNFLGRIPNNKIPEIINQNEIFILPSYYEGNPKALLEAMSCGIPCIGSNVSGIRSIIKHKENGFLCKTDPKSIRNAILNLYYDKKLRVKISKNARHYILENCSLEAIADKEFNIYKDVLKN
ncbi:MAG: glycosyltransferase family 4 protein [Promethearchaeota archaeon]